MSQDGIVRSVHQRLLNLREQTGEPLTAALWKRLRVVLHPGPAPRP